MKGSRRMKIMRQSLFMILTATQACMSASCDSNPYVPPVCTDEYVWGLEIRLVDKDTGGPAGLGASVVIRDGDYVENRIGEDFGALGVATFAAGERAGFYEITINAVGFKEWRRDRVLVSRNQCHVITEKILAELIREDPLFNTSRSKGPEIGL
jgi:hypothetical protein